MKVTDEELTKRAIEILNMSIAIQVLVISKETEGLDFVYLTKEEEDKTLERVIMRIRDNNRVFVEAGEFTWDLTILRSKPKRKEKQKGTPAQ